MSVDYGLLSYLSGFLTERRLARFREVLAHRTRYLTVILEDIYQPHNASAVLRSCDGFGVQDVHIIENRNTYRVNPDVALGSSQWLTLTKYNRNTDNTARAITDIRNAGYRVAATSPHHDDVRLEDLDLAEGKVAFLLGNELDGLSPTAADHADFHLRIPIYGFVESFNISVAAAVILHHATLALRNSDLPWQLSRGEQDELLFEWVRRSAPRSEALEREYYRSIEGTGGGAAEDGPTRRALPS
ncbi:MAG: TrmH family RNA methyltransferase [Spirochaetaceae bacterium]